MYIINSRLPLVYLDKIEYNASMEIMNVNKKYNNQKLSKYVLDNMPIGYNSFCKLLRKKDIQINGKRTNKDELVKMGDEVKVFFKLEVKDDLEIHYEDDNIVVVNKGVGIEVEGQISVTSKLEVRYPGIDIKACHRLDRNTKGLAVFAKNKEALELLEKQFKERNIEKYYVARVHNHPKAETEILEAYLFKDNKNAIVYIDKESKTGYKKIVTKYTVLEKRNDNTAILEVELLTGRTHQIRAHLAYVGHPIIGDGKYGVNEVNKEYGKKYQELISYMIRFKFEKETLLGYLDGKELKIDYEF